MTLKAISVGGTYRNLAEADRSFEQLLTGSRKGVFFNYAATQSACTDLQVTPTSGVHSVDIGAGRASMPEKTSPASRGGYLFIADATDTVALPVPQSQGFYATVVARVTDPQYGTVTGDVGPRIDIVSGTAGGSPSPVSDATIDGVTNTPGGWTRLADVLINSGDSGAIPGGQITDRRTPAFVGHEARGWSSNPPLSPVRGDSLYCYDTGLTLQFHGNTIWGNGARKIIVGLGQSSFNNGNTITTLSIPAQPRASRVMLEFNGDAGFSASTDIVAGINASANAGSLFAPLPTAGCRYAVAGSWYAYNWSGYLDLAANTASTVTFTAAVSSSNCYFAGIFKADILLSGEYA